MTAIRIQSTEPDLGRPSIKSMETECQALGGVGRVVVLATLGTVHDPVWPTRRCYSTTQSDELQCFIPFQMNNCFTTVHVNDFIL